MRIGSTAMFFKDKSVCEALENIARCGFQAAEVWMQHLLQTNEVPEDVAQRGQELGLELSLHANTYDVNVASTTPRIREESLRQIYQSIVTASQMEARVVVVHPGRLSTIYGNVETCRQLMNAALEKINKWAVAEGVSVGVESMEKRANEVFVTPADMQRLLRPEWNAIGFTLDLSHAYTFMDPVAYIEQFDPQSIMHVHFSDASEHTVHSPLGIGKMNIHAALSVLNKNFNGIAIVEGYVPGRGDETVRGNATYLKNLGWL